MYTYNNMQYNHIRCFAQFFSLISPLNWQRLIKQVYWAMDKWLRNRRWGKGMG